MKPHLFTIFTRTPLHVGAGASVGAVDQPVVRERHTRFPVIPGSSLKGVLADLFMKVGEDVEKKERKDKNGKVVGYDYVRIKDGIAWRLFGDNSNENGNSSSGSLLVGESKLLVFPIRSAKGCFAYATCPLALERFKRDTGIDFAVPAVPDNKAAVVSEDSILKFKSSKNVVFEEYPLDAKVDQDEKIKNLAKVLDKLSDDPAWKNADGPARKNADGSESRNSVLRRLAVVSNELFQYFVENNCEIANHNVIDDGTGVVKNFFNQENVPSETMFYCTLHFKELKEFDDFSEAKQKKALTDRLSPEKNLLQIGADLTTGLGWCSVKLPEPGSTEQ